jgi:valyl-tRNA synthetase
MAEWEMPSRFQPAEAERHWYDVWETKGHFGSEPDEDRKPYTIVIPPPNVTGVLHMGHALNNTLQDIVIRFRKMQGFNALWIPGTDHAGIATQNVVERMIATEGLTRDQLGREKFLQRVWKWKEENGGTIINQLRRLGSSCDWSRTRFTMDEGLSKAVRHAFVRLFNDGLIYRGTRLIHWCTRCRTALADDEVDNKEAAGHLWFIKYPVKGERAQFVEVATTRPETMLGDVAVAVHPGDERYQALIGKTLVLPLMEREIPLVADEAVDPRFGTGAVKVTPGHDAADFEIGARHSLPVISVMAADGTMNENAGAFSGLDRFVARDKVVETLTARDLIVKVEDHAHTNPQCYRCSTVVEPRISDQWFVKMKELAKPAIEAAQKGKLRFHPARWEREYMRWLDSVRDWCISRQIWWGHRIPVWTCQDCEKVIASITDPASCPQCGGADLVQDPDVLDTWFSSSLWPFSTLGWPDDTKDLEYYYPTSTLITDRGILYFWVARMVMMGLRLMRNVPFTDVYIHGTVLDEQGRKMSKSLGNGIDPIEMIDQYGADAVRASLVLLTSEGQDVKLSVSKFEMGRNFANKVWNAARYAMTRLVEAPPTGGVDESQLSLSDRWILSRLQKTIAKATAAFDEFRYNEAITTIYEFLWNEFCAWYIELTKFRLRESGPGAVAARAVLAHVLDRSLRLLHPICPYLTEEIWSRLRQVCSNREIDPGAEADPAETLAGASWPAHDVKRVNEPAEESMRVLQEIVTAVRNIRSQRNVEPRAEVPVSVSCDDEALASLLAPHTSMIRELARGNPVEVGQKLVRPEGAAVAVLTGAQVYVPIQIDVQAERERVSKQLTEEQKRLHQIEQRLRNGQYLEKAPHDVVERDRSRREELLARIDQLSKSLEGLQ